MRHFRPIWLLAGLLLGTATMVTLAFLLTNATIEPEEEPVVVDDSRWKELLAEGKRAGRLSAQSLIPWGSPTLAGVARIRSVTGDLTEETEQAFTLALQEAKRIDSKGPRVASTIEALANAYIAHGQVEKASPLFEQSYRIMSNRLPSDDPLLAGRLDRFAEKCSACGEYDLAFEFARQAFLLRVQAPNPDLVLITRNIDKLIQLSRGFDRDDEKIHETEDCCKHVLRLLEEHRGERAAVFSNSFDFLLNRNWEVGRLDEAEEMLMKELELQQQDSARPSLGLASTLHELAKLYIDRERYAEAEEFCEKAIRVYDVVLKRTDPDRIRAFGYKRLRGQAIRTYAEICRRTGREKEANEVESAGRLPSGPRSEATF